MEGAIEFAARSMPPSPVRYGAADADESDPVLVVAQRLAAFPARMAF